MASTNSISIAPHHSTHDSRTSRVTTQSLLADRLLASKVKTNTTSNSNRIDDAATVTVSDAARAEKTARQKAVRTLSDANSYVSVSEDAVTKIGELVDKASAIAETLTGAVTADQRTALSSEAQSLINEINTVVSKAEFNGRSVINNGTQQFTVDFASGSGNSDKAFSVTVENIRASVATLGLSSLTTSSFANSPSTAISALTNAQASITAIHAALAGNAADISNIAEQYGLKVGQSAGAANGALDAAKALGKAISSSLRDQLSAVSTSLDPIVVNDLVKSPQPEPKVKQPSDEQQKQNKTSNPST